MKRILSILLAICLMLPAASAFALFDFTGTLGNEATFETLEEARENGPAVIADAPDSAAMGNTGLAQAANPVLADFPAGTAFVYRSADMYGGFAAGRMNSVFLVYTTEQFDEKAEALAYIQGLGLTALADEVRGSVVLVTPTAPETMGSSGITGGFGAADQKHFYNLLTAITAFKAKAYNADGSRTNYADSEYYGTFKNLYVIGIGGGATFLNNYVAGIENFVGRIAGMLLINGKMDPLSKVASLIPVYLVNADAATIAKYKAANQVDAWKEDLGLSIWYDKELPVRRVILAETDAEDYAPFIRDAFDRIFKRTMRIQVLKNSLISAGTTWMGMTGDCAPYSLNRRVVIGRDGMTEMGSQIIKCVDLETFKDIQISDGEYLTIREEPIKAPGRAMLPGAGLCALSLGWFTRFSCRFSCSAPTSRRRRR